MNFRYWIIGYILKIYYFCFLKYNPYYYRHLNAFERYFGEKMAKWRLEFQIDTRDIKKNRYLTKLYRDYLLRMMSFGEYKCSDNIYRLISSIPNNPAYIYIIINFFLINTVMRRNDDGLFGIFLCGDSNVGNKVSFLKSFLF